MKIKKIIILSISLLFLVCLVSCSTSSLIDDSLYSATSLYEDDVCFVSLKYVGLDLEGLNIANNKNNNLFRSSITFADYSNGYIGGIRDVDLQLTNHCGYEIYVSKGENVIYPFWALVFTNDDSDVYYEMLENGVDEKTYKLLPFLATDTMSFGYTEDGDRSCLYCAQILCQEETNGRGGYLWNCTGSNPGAKYTCTSQSIQSLIAANCINVAQALAFVGAKDEKDELIYPLTTPSLNVITSDTIDNTYKCFYGLCALEDSSGRHGVLEFIDNNVYWHEDLDYAFDFIIHEKYLFNDDNTYREKNGRGIGRCTASVPYLPLINTTEDHLKLMNSINYSNMTYYNEENGIVGYDISGKKIDWRSEFTNYDVFKTYDLYIQSNIDTSKADEFYSLYSSYLDTKTNEIIVINSYDAWLENNSHLKCIYDLNFCLDDSNYNELMNVIKWNGKLYQSLSEEDIIKAGNAWITYFRVIVDPMNYRVTRWLNEEITTSKTINFSDFY